eukprot:5760545-Amphidinium_carterae.1
MTKKGLTKQKILLLLLLLLSTRAQTQTRLLCSGLATDPCASMGQNKPRAWKAQEELRRVQCQESRAQNALADVCPSRAFRFNFFPQHGKGQMTGSFFSLF